MLKDFLAQVSAGEHLSQASAQQSMEIIMSGQASEAQIGAFLTALKMKGETSGEIAGFAATMRAHAVKVECCRTYLVDTCGTGGDKKQTFNISTAAAFVAAGAGATVAKHGNRGVSSSCGSADVLTALGVRVELPPQVVAGIINDIQIGFLYAPCFHQAMKYAAKPRQELGFRTVFNVLGPLTNPAGANYQVIGVYEQALTAKLAEALVSLGVRRAMVVHALDGLDEISTLAPTQVTEVENGKISTYLLHPDEYGFNSGGPNAYQGGTPAENAAILLSILQGETGPRRDIVLVNAAAALVVAGRAETIAEGLRLAAASIDSGAALAKLEALRAFSRNCEGEWLS